MPDILLPPSITLRAASTGVAVVTLGGVSVEVNLPRPRSLHGLSEQEMQQRTRHDAREALLTAARSLEDA